jgi:outer membrane protein OmpA-like peptidoglycan-associated protein
MARCVWRIAIAVLVIGNVAQSGFCQTDREGCEDHPLLTRIEAFYIEGCNDQEFGSAKFDTKDGRKDIEGHLISVSYRRPSSAPEMSNSEIVGNYTNAVEAIGGEVTYKGGYSASMKVVVEGKEVWIRVMPGGKRAYRLDIVEIQGIRQQVVADAAALLADLDRAGHTVLHGVFFNTDKAVLKPESSAALSEIAKLLDDNPSMKAYVVGHTDMTGSFEHNIDLSKRRAAAVVEALVAERGISSSRLTPQGIGPLAPIGSNDTETGRALNRRVELVKR